MKRIVAIILVALFCAQPGVAQTIRNANAYPVFLREGPGLFYPETDRLDPGEVADLGHCDERGLWCIVSTNAKWGWINVSVLGARGGTAAAPLDPMDVAPQPVPMYPVFVDPLPDAPDRASPEAPRVADGVPPLIFSVTEPFGNVTAGLVNMRAGPGTENAVVGRLRPGEGGRIDVCNPAQDWCRIAAPGVGPAWVKMTLMGAPRPRPAAGRVDVAPARP